MLPEAEGVPVIQTLHNYRILCPNALLFRDGNVCEECLGSPVAWRAVAHACYRQSRISSALVTTMLAVHRAFDTWDKMVDLYIADSSFCRNKYVQAGFARERVAVKPGFVSPDPGEGEHRGDYCLFVGRLSEGKGLDVLFDAWRKLGPSFPLKVVGDGPRSPVVAAAVREMPWIEWLGFKPPTEVLQLMGEARVLVVPSQWYETFGLVVVEGFAKGTPTIVADGGALAELVRHGCNGLHFDAPSSDSIGGKRPGCPRRRHPPEADGPQRARRLPSDLHGLRQCRSARGAVPGGSSARSGRRRSVPCNRSPLPGFLRWKKQSSKFGCPRYAPRAW